MAPNPKVGIRRPPRNRPPPLLVAIVGGSGSGKSWLAQRLHRALGRQAARLSLDDFYREHPGLSAARRARLNFDHPRAIDWPELQRVLGQLLAGKATRVPSYDFATHSRRRASRPLAPRGVILLEGLWLLRRPALRRQLAWSLFLDCPARTRLARRLARDVRARGRTPASVRRQFRTMVEPMHRRFVAPQARWADVLLRPGCGTDEVRVLASYVRRAATSPRPACPRDGRVGTGRCGSRPPSPA